MNPRTIAAKVIQLTLEGRSLADTLENHPTKKDNALIHEMCFGVMRWHLQLEFIISELMDKPLKDKDSDVHALLLIGLYQLIFMRIPAHASINETVGACKKAWAKKVINGVLRSYERKADEIQQKVLENTEAHFSHPAWLVRNIKNAWPDNADAILKANNEHAPMTLRVNALKTKREDYIELLKEIKATPCALSTSHLTLETPLAAKKLPKFDKGFVSVQDEAPGLAATYLACEPGDIVLDACAAPGGKTCHLLEAQPDIKKLTAIDRDASRLKMVTENVNRLKLKAKTICADASNTDWWDSTPFNRILLDAPCSATGVIRRHPDIKYLRQPEDIHKVAETQLALLTSLWPMLAPGGTLLYATCSILPAENDDVIDLFLANTADAKIKILSGGMPTKHGIQFLPGVHNTDGFYYAALLK